MSVLSWPNKDPDEVLDYSIDWSARLSDTDFITSSTWVNLTSSGLIRYSSSSSSTITTIWFSGGTLDLSYIITNRVVTNEGRTMDQSAKIKIKAK
jgi:hypothetical protein